MDSEGGMQRGKTQGKGRHRDEMKVIINCILSRRNFRGILFLLRFQFQSLERRRVSFGVGRQVGRAILKKSHRCCSLFSVQMIGLLLR